MENQLSGLRIKVVSLMDEAKQIRKSERVAKTYKEYAYLRNHRVNDIRPEQRLALLAYAYLRGKAYRSQEATARKPVNFKRLYSLVAKFGAAPGSKLELTEGVLEAWVKGLHLHQPQPQTKEV